MSDSRAKENVEADKAGKPDADKTAAVSEKAREVDPKGGREGTSGPQGKAAQSERKGKTWPIWLLVAALVTALAGFAWVLASQLFFTPVSNQQEARAPGSDQNVNAAGQQGEQDDGKPISILPEKNGEDFGVTILQKQPETDDEGKPVTLAPIAQGADIASGFAMDLGAADSYLELSRRFADIANVNGPENFRRLEPRAVLRETVTGLEARLLVGPFETRKEATEACAILVLDASLECLPTEFEGELIPRD